jgi:hypothetical protein
MKRKQRTLLPVEALAGLRWGPCILDGRRASEDFRFKATQAALIGREVIGGDAGQGGPSSHAGAFRGARNLRFDPRHVAEEARLQERQSLTYILVTGVMILFVVFALICLNW